MPLLKISAKQKILIERYGVLFEKTGHPPIVGRVYALLIVADKTEFTFDEIRQILFISKSAASNALNFLLKTGKIDYFTKTGNRKRFFRVCPGQWRNDMKKNFKQMLEITDLLNEILAQRTSLTKEFNYELHNFIEFLEFLEHELPILYQKWELKIPEKINEKYKH